MTDHTVKVNFEQWQRLRTAAFYKCKPIKTLLNEILEGEMDPITLEEIKGEK